MPSLDARDKFKIVRRSLSAQLGGHRSSLPGEPVFPIVCIVGSEASEKICCDNPFFLPSLHQMFESTFHFADQNALLRDGIANSNLVASLTALGEIMKYPFQSYFKRPDRDLQNVAENIAANQSPKPVVWMLGKTGAGKSSLVRSLTGLSSAEIGNGFESCTRTAAFFDFPQDMPVMRFLDTRGLGEAGYDPTDDIGECEGHSSVILAVARLDDPVQGELAETIASVLQRKPSTRVILVHTAADLIEDAQERARVQAVNQRKIDEAVGTKTPFVSLSLAQDSEDQTGINELLDILRETMPEVATLLMQEDLRDAESRRFAEIRNWVISCAAVAATSDVLPLAGIVGVPASQMAMLRKLATHYEVTWSRKVMSEFLAALGVGVAARFGASFGLRQISKLIPVYGQTVGAAAAGAISFSATYALGRSAAYYLDRMQRGAPIDKDEMRAVFTSAFAGARRGQK